MICTQFMHKNLNSLKHISHTPILGLPGWSLFESWKMLEFMFLLQLVCLTCLAFDLSCIKYFHTSICWNMLQWNAICFYFNFHVSNLHCILNASDLFISHPCFALPCNVSKLTIQLFLKSKLHISSRSCFCLL